MSKKKEYRDTERVFQVKNKKLKIHTDNVSKIQ